MRGKNSKKILSLVFGDAAFDGRLIRFVEVIEKKFPIEVISLDLGGSVTWQNAKVKKVKLKKTPGRKVTNHLVFWFYCLLTAFRSKPSVIVGHNFFTVFPAMVLAKLTRSKFVYDAYELIIPEKAAPKNLRNQIWYLLEKLSVHRANLVIVANEQRAKIMQVHYGLCYRPLVIPNFPGSPKYVIPQSEIFRYYPIVEKARKYPRLLLYQGYIDSQRGLFHFIDAMQLLDESYCLLLVGSGPDLEMLRAYVEKIGLSGRILFAGPVPHDYLYSISRICDLGIVTYPYTGLNNIYCSPNKLFEYAVAGLPVVTTAQPPLREMVERYQIGICIQQAVNSCEQARVCANAIKKAFDMITVFKNNLPDFVEAHKWENEAKKLEGAMTALIEEKCSNGF